MQRSYFYSSRKYFYFGEKDIQNERYPPKKISFLVYQIKTKTKKNNFVDLLFDVEEISQVAEERVNKVDKYEEIFNIHSSFKEKIFCAIDNQEVSTLNFSRLKLKAKFEMDLYLNDEVN